MAKKQRELIKELKEKINRWEFNPIWIYVSIFIYLLVRIIEYTTGQKGTPEWVIDFFPYILPLAFVLVDNMLKIKGQNETSRNSRTNCNKTFWERLARY